MGANFKRELNQTFCRNGEPKIRGLHPSSDMSVFLKTINTEEHPNASECRIPNTHSTQNDHTEGQKLICVEEQKVKS